MIVPINNEIEKMASKYKVLVNMLSKKCLICHNHKKSVDTAELKKILLELSNEIPGDITQLVRIESGKEND